jgi:hypothetical protein
MTDGSTRCRIRLCSGTPNDRDIRSRSRDVAFTPCATLTAMNGVAVSATAATGAFQLKPYQRIASSAQITPGTARPTSTMSLQNARTRSDRPIAMPSATPTTSAIASPRRNPSSVL